MTPTTTTRTNCRACIAADALGGRCATHNPPPPSVPGPPAYVPPRSTGCDGCAAAHTNADPRMNCPRHGRPSLATIARKGGIVYRTEHRDDGTVVMVYPPALPSRTPPPPKPSTRTHAHLRAHSDPTARQVLDRIAPDADRLAWHRAQRLLADRPDLADAPDGIATMFLALHAETIIDAAQADADAATQAHAERCRHRRMVEWHNRRRAAAWHAWRTATDTATGRTGQPPAARRIGPGWTPPPDIEEPRTTYPQTVEEIEDRIIAKRTADHAGPDDHATMDIDHQEEPRPDTPRRDTAAAVLAATPWLRTVRRPGTPRWTPPPDRTP